MENLKIKVNNEAESKEAQELFFELGYAWLNTKKEYQDIGKYNYISSFNYSNRMELGMGYGAVNHKEVAIPQLRDMVVLKRNSIEDATHEYHGCSFYLDSNGKFHQFMGAFWFPAVDCYWDVESIKRFPIQNNDLPLDSEESLNDKIASAEEARQKQPNKKTIDVMDGVKLMESLARFNNTDRGADFDNFELFEKHSHYKKDVSHLEFIDVYRVLDLFGVESHAVGHAVKKLLCSGQRGAKDKAQDIQEAIDSLNRELEMMKENESSKD